MSYRLEICSYNLKSALIAQEAGADRVEFCADPADGGTTPGPGLIRIARESLHIQLYPIIRPRGGDFYYSPAEFKAMAGDIDYCKQLGCDGVVIGMLGPDGKVDRAATARLVERAYPMGVTFHRAFDRAVDPFEALETLIDLGCERILTSGQRPLATQGAGLIRELVAKAAGRIVIMPGSGVKGDTLETLVRETGAEEFHSSAKTAWHSEMLYKNPGMEEDLDTIVAERTDIERMVKMLKEWK